MALPTDLHLRVVTPDRTVVDRKVSAVRFQGVDGSYGILPGHAPLMTAIANTGSIYITETDGRKSDLFASDGFVQVQHNVMTVVCEAGELATEIDLERTKQAEAKAREQLAHLDPVSEEYLKAEAALQRALQREELARRASATGNVR